MNKWHLLAGAAIFVPGYALAQCAQGLLVNCPPPINLQSTDLAYCWQLGQTPHSRSCTVAQMASASAALTFASPPAIGNNTPNNAFFTTASISGLLTAVGGITASSLFDSGLLTAAGGITASSLFVSGLTTVSGLASFSNGITASSVFDSGLLTAVGGVTASAVFDSGLLTAAGGVTASSLFVSGLSTFSGAASFSTITTSAQATFSGVVTAPQGIAGNVGGTNAATGIVGEIVTSIGTASVTASGTTISVTSLSIGAGDWDCNGWNSFSLTASTIALQAWLTPGYPAVGSHNNLVSTAATFGNGSIVTVDPYQEISSSTVTVSLIGYASITASITGFLRCRRMR